MEEMLLLTLKLGYSMESYLRTIEGKYITNFFKYSSYNIIKNYAPNSNQVKRE